MSDHNYNLTEIREKIDQLDEKLTDLLNQRASLALLAAKIKMAEQTDFYRPDREAQVLKRIGLQNQGPLPQKSLFNIFRVIMTECRQLEIVHHSEKKS